MKKLYYYHTFNFKIRKVFIHIGLLIIITGVSVFAQPVIKVTDNSIRQCILINENRHFYKYHSMAKEDSRACDVRPEICYIIYKKPAADHYKITSDGKDLSFIIVKVTDKNGLTALRVKNLIKFCSEDPGEIVAADVGDPTDMVPFPSLECGGF